MSIQKKEDHIQICLDPASQIGTAGWEKYRFVHQALPDVAFDAIDTSCEFLGRHCDLPLMISGMTGGSETAAMINQHIALACETARIPFGVGSMRIAIEQPQTASSFQVRAYAPNVPILANLGLVQLNYGFELDECKRAVELIEADAMMFHLNPIQEAISQDGNTDFTGLMPKLEKIIRHLGVPVLVKEVGFGISAKVAQELRDVGVRTIDIAGWGGTNWAYVEGRRTGNSLGAVFSTWGIPTSDAVRDCSKIVGLSVIAGGGMRSGVDMAKAMALGASMSSIAQPVLAAALQSPEAVLAVIDRYLSELKAAMFALGAGTLQALQAASIEVRE